MGENHLNLGRLGWLIGVAILVMIANIAISVLYMVVYGHVIDPGQGQQYYADHIEVAAPYCSIIAGIPLMFLAGRWVGGWGGSSAVKSALIVWLTYAVIDLVILLGAGMTTRVAILVAVSLITKLVAVYFGALFAGRQYALV